MKNYIKNKNGLDKTQIIYDKDNTGIGSILSINYNIKQNINENPVDDNERANKTKKNNITNENNIIANEKEKNTISISDYIKPLFLSLLKIEELNNFYVNDSSLISEKDNLSNLLYQLISKYNNKK